MSRWKTLKHRAVVLLLRALGLLSSGLPLPVALALGAAIGRCARLFTPRLARRSRSQLELALELAPDEAGRLSGEVFAHLGRLAVELLVLPKLRRRLPALVALPEDARGVLRRALDEGGPAAIAVTAHLGNWELLAQRIAADGFPISAAARANPNAVLGRWLVAARAQGGVETLERGRSTLGLRAALRRPGFIAFLIDQDTRVPSVFAPFFGRPAKTPRGPAELAIRRDLPVVLGLIHREGRGHRIEIRRIEHRDLLGTSAERIQALTERLNAGIEAAVRAHPEQWVWVHDRWRSRPT